MFRTWYSPLSIHEHLATPDKYAETLAESALTSPCLRSPKCAARKPGGRNEEKQAKDQHSRRNGPPALHAIHARIKKLDQRNQNHQVAERALCSKNQEHTHHDGQRKITRSQVACVDANRFVDLVMRAHQHG